MSDQEQRWEDLVHDLRERAKELACLYRVGEALAPHDRPIGEALRDIVQAMPPGWQYSHICRARVTLNGEQYVSDGFQESPWAQRAAIVVDGQEEGSV
jgi:hypothetical protein